MGREAVCACMWNGTRHNVKALLEPPEIILRGELLRRVSFGNLKNITTDGEWLRFETGHQQVALQLGTSIAPKWADVLLKPPPSLAKKLGITSEKTVRVIGAVDDDALRNALNEAKAVSKSKGDLILARVNTAQDLKAALAKAASQLDSGTPIWFIYRKGPGHPLNENQVRAIALATGIVDTKIAAVSSEFSGLRFVKRRT